ncbi:class I SAM-dependent methyltransferase [Patescibacteria group bacterium]|nr:class I SAM-dependent methyltransferase [Patescibacteria group bacterium]
MDKRIENEIKHGFYIVEKGESVWNWSSPAGIKRWQRRVDMFRLFLGNNSKNVLEVGCGTGLFTKELAKTDNKIIAIDISEELIEKARKKILGSNNILFKIENAYNTSFKDNSFDFIVGSSVLHHLDAEAAIKEFYRILKPGGQLMFTEPNMLNPQIFLQKNIPFLKKMAGDSPDETAFFRWSVKNELLTKGFKDAVVVPFDFMHPAIPKSLIFLFEKVFFIFEKLPILKEIAGSLLITAKKPIINQNNG